MAVIDYENDGKTLTLYAMEEKDVFGKLVCEPEDEDVFRIRSLVVDSAWRRQGYGRALVEAAVDLSGNYLSGDEIYAMYVLSDETEPCFKLLESMGFEEEEEYSGDVYMFTLGDVSEELSKHADLSASKDILPLKACPRAVWTKLSEKLENLEEPITLREMTGYEQEASVVLLKGDEPNGCMLISRGADGTSEDVLIDCLYNNGSPMELLTLMCICFQSAKDGLKPETKIYVNAVNEKVKALLQKFTGGSLQKIGRSVVQSLELL